MNKDIFLSIIVPVYNEADKIEKTISSIVNYVDKKYSYEIVIVDDGSRDETGSKIKKITGQGLPIRFLKNDVNVGKGAALKKGMTAAEGKYVVFTDADLSTPFEEIEKLLPYLKEGYDISFGSRKLKESDVKVYQPWYRVVMGYVFYFFARILVVSNVNDFNCGFKAFNNIAAHKLFDKIRIKRWGYDVEMFYLAKKYGFKIKEVPVSWSNSNTSKVSLFKDAIRSFVDLIEIRVNDMKGFYK
jgi:dolichyl-phosphate beta-glucosyltransferase